MSLDNWLTLLFNPILPHGDINGIAVIIWLTLTALVICAIIEREGV